MFKRSLLIVFFILAWPRESASKDMRPRITGLERRFAPALGGPTRYMLIPSRRAGASPPSQTVILDLFCELLICCLKSRLSATRCAHLELSRHQATLGHLR